MVFFRNWTLLKKQVNVVAIVKVTATTHQQIEHWVMIHRWNEKAGGQGPRPRPARGRGPTCSRGRQQIVHWVMIHRWNEKATVKMAEGEDDIWILYYGIVLMVDKFASHNS